MRQCAKVEERYHHQGDGVRERRFCIDPVHELLSTQRQCELIDLPRSSYYRQTFLRREADKNLALMRLIDEEYTKHPFYGTRKMRNLEIICPDQVW